ncbi:MAG: antitoxin MazE family protein [Ilumatobacteraceae bacterium]
MARRQYAAPVAERVRDHRARLRSQGLRPIQIWVPDVRTPEFTAQAHAQSLAVAGSEHDGDDQAFIDALSLDAE